MNPVVTQGIRTSFDLYRLFLNGAQRLPGVSRTVSAGIGLLAAGTSRVVDCCDDPAPSDDAATAPSEPLPVRRRRRV